MSPTAGITKTQQLIDFLQEAEQNGVDHVIFYVGRYTGSGPAVIGALRRRGFLVSRLPGGSYELRRMTTPDLPA